MNGMREILLACPDSQIDAIARELVEKWSDPPKALQILEVLDLCIYGGLASGLVVRTLQVMYDATCKQEGVTHEQLVPLATWRTSGAMP